MTVSDVTAPVVTCAAPVTINTTSGQCTGTTALTPPTITDNCAMTMGNGLHFDGSDNVVYSNGNQGLLSTSNASQPYTIEMWMNASSSNNNEGGLFTQYLNSSGSTRFGIRLSSSNRIAYWKGGSYLLTSTTVLADNKWHHIAFVKVGSGTGQLQLYVDGVLDATGTDGTVFEAANVRLGFFNGAGDGYTGAMDELRVWDVARTQSEVATNRYKELSAQSNLILAYHMNEGTAGGTNTGITTASDASGNSRSGTLSNSFALSGPSSNWVAGAVPPATNDAPATYPIGSTTVTWNAGDLSGNTATCTQTVTVLAPEINVASGSARRLVFRMAIQPCQQQTIHSLAHRK